MDHDPVALLMTRPVGATRRFLALLSETTLARLQVIESPLIRIDRVAHEPLDVTQFAAIFTSRNGVCFAPASEGRPAFCLGAGTTAAAAEQGWQARCMGQDAESLVSALLCATPRLPVVHFSGRHTRGAVVERLSAEGFDARRTIVYDQKLLPLAEMAVGMLLAGRPVVAPLFSPRTASHFASFLPMGANLSLVAMSPAVAMALPLPWRDQCGIATEPTLNAMAFEVEKRAAQDSLG